jgi:hypothetical protein
MLTVAILGGLAYAGWRAVEVIPDYAAARRDRAQGALPGTAYTQASLPNATGRMPVAL